MGKGNGRFNIDKVENVVYLCVALYTMHGGDLAYSSQ